MDLVTYIKHVVCCTHRRGLFIFGLIWFGVERSLGCDHCGVCAYTPLATPKTASSMMLLTACGQVQAELYASHLRSACCYACTAR